MFDDEQIVGDIVQSISGLGLGDLNEQAFLISKPLYFETNAAIKPSETLTRIHVHRLLTLK